MSGLDNMKMRMQWAGGDADGRLVKGKLQSLQSALQNSYQAEWITLAGERYRCLINPDKTKEDFDQKEISIEFESGMKVGNTFYWDRTDTYWIVYLQQLSEEAYFRAQIRRCNYQIDIDGTPYWVYTRGPLETNTIWNEKHNINLNDLNYSLLMYVPKDEITQSYFERFKIIKFDGHNWQVAAVDRYSQDGIIEVHLNEYFDNEDMDNMVQPEIIEPDIELPYIDGPQLVNVYDINLSYEIKNASNGSFVVNSSKVKIEKADENSCVLTILTGKSTKFILSYVRDGEEEISLPITVQSF